MREFLELSQGSLLRNDHAEVNLTVCAGLTGNVIHAHACVIWMGRLPTGYAPLPLYSWPFV